MPLPAALAAKLSKRGIITPKVKQHPDHPKKTDFKGLSVCPNKSNIYHDCTHWCETHWKGSATPDHKYVRLMQKILMSYPLPNTWTEIFDKGVGKYYYWDMENDLVSWLPPKHPKAVITKSAAKLREKRILDQKSNLDPVRERREKETNSRSNQDDGERDSDHSDDEKDYRSKHYSDRRERDRDDSRKSRREERYRGSKKPRNQIIDPMDPAAYSDIPVGTWSDGLESNQTRADNTASGVLYQQRPYPAPGEVLAANKEKLKKK